MRALEMRVARKCRTRADEHKRLDLNLPQENERVYSGAWVRAITIIYNFGFYVRAFQILYSSDISRPNQSLYRLMSCPGKLLQQGHYVEAYPFSHSSISE